MSKAIKVIASFLLVILISGAFILWPQIETHLFGEDEYIIIKDVTRSDTYTSYTDSISIFSVRDWNKNRYVDLLMDLDAQKDGDLINPNEHKELLGLLEEAYTNTLKNSISNWTKNRCIDDSINIIKKEILILSDSNLTYKGYLEKEIKILETYNEITNDLSNKINYLIIQKYDTLKVRSYKSLISKYKKNKHFNKCNKVIDIIKESEIKIQNYKMYVKEFNNNIIYYIENYKVVKRCNDEHSYTCTIYIESFGKSRHENYVKEQTSGILDYENPYKFDYTSNGDPLICYEYKDYTHYFNELKTKKICD